MCFSAHASFGAAIVLGGIGLLSVRRAAPKNRLLAAMPLFFAAQQLNEGFLWLEIDVAPFGLSASRWGLGFLAFALFLWPLFVPLALGLAETEKPRRRLLLVLAILGGALGAYLFACAAFRPSNACLAFGNLYYWVQIDSAFKRAALFGYLALVAIPFVVSTLRGTKLFGLATIVSFAAAAILFKAGFASVWCFFAAVLSGIAAVVSAARAESRRPRSWTRSVRSS